MNIRRVFAIGVTLLVGMLILMINVKTTIAAGTFYVTPVGDDGNACTDPTEPCATIQAAISKAAAGDTIKVSVGIYSSVENQIVSIDKDLFLLGGWDLSFISQTGKSILDGGGGRREIYVPASVTAVINSFTLQNGVNGILNYGNLTVSTIDVFNNYNPDYCWGAGVLNEGTMRIEWSNIAGNECSSGYGGGIYNWEYGGPLTIVNSTISGNQAPTGGGIYASNTVTIINSTISNNTSDSGSPGAGGGGIFVAARSTVALKNTTVTENESTGWGGGIEHYYGWGSITLENSIVAGNVAFEAWDCSGPVSSVGYNIVGDTLGCIITASTGDQLNVDPELGELQDNGGPTFTHWLYANSPAIDQGNPSGCKDESGTVLTIDQRGYTRPLDGDENGDAVCDIGAFEADPDNLPPAPVDVIWYVSLTGDDSNDCLAPATPCASINGALNKAQPGNLIYTAVGIYSNPAGNEVVLIEKEISLLGGWDLTFSNQVGSSVIDGENARRGITIGAEVKAYIEYFTIQNCKSAAGDGGGIFVGYRDRVTLDHVIVQDNLAGDLDWLNPTYYSGGGIGMSNYAMLTINHSQILRNQATSEAGGIKVGFSDLIMTESIVAENIAGLSGGIGKTEGGNIVLTECSVIDNESTFGPGGGINSFNSYLTMNHSVVMGNVTASEGGGIYGHEMTILDSVVGYNIADSGGGIYIFSQGARIERSAVIGNQANSGYGGGIWNGGNLVMINTTIANNRAEMPYSDDADGGGIYQAAGSLEVSNVTVARNSAEHAGGGIFNTGTQLTLRNTILAENHSPSGPDCSGTVSTAGYNLLENTSGCTFTAGASDMVNQWAGINRLFGFAQAMLLFADSPAIDSGNPDGCTDHLGNPILVDQLGSARPINGDDQGGAYCDIGAVEYDPDFTPGWSFIPLLMTSMP